MPRVIENYFATISHIEGFLTKEIIDEKFFKDFASVCIAEEPHYQLVNGVRTVSGYHLHVVFADRDKTGIAEMQSKIRSVLDEIRGDAEKHFLGFDLQACRSVKTSITYITKYDVCPILRGFDYDYVSTLCKIHSVASFKEYDPMDPLAFNLRAQYNFLTNVWNLVFKSHDKNGSCHLCEKRSPLGILRGSGDKITTTPFRVSIASGFTNAFGEQRRMPMPGEISDDETDDDDSKIVPPLIIKLKQ